VTKPSSLFIVGRSALSFRVLLIGMYCPLSEVSLDCVAVMLTATSQLHSVIYVCGQGRELACSVVELAFLGGIPQDLFTGSGVRNRPNTISTWYCFPGREQDYT
jgi:hypothetical protein